MLKNQITHIKIMEENKMDKQKLLAAIDKRCSRRAYIEKEIEAVKIEKLQEIIKNINSESGLNIQFYQNGKEFFNSFKSSYGMFSGISAYFALVGNKTDKHLFEKAGYYGEILVLEATGMDLGTCWIGGSYDKKSCEKQIKLGADEELVAVIIVGYAKENKTLKEKIISGLAHRRTKTIQEMYTAEEKNIPDNFINGMHAVQKAPSAMNGQPVQFHYGDGTVTAKVEENPSYRKIDLGIAMLHFELGAVSDNNWDLDSDEHVLKLS